MHRLLKRQLKKTGADVDEEFLKLVEQTYVDFDEDRELLERSLELSSKEMKELYTQLEENAQEKIRRSEERYNKLIFALRDYYYFFAQDLDGNIIYVSDSVENILGYSPEETKKHFTNFLTDEKINEVAYEAFSMALSGEPHSPMILSIKHKDGTTRYIEVTDFPILDKDGNVVEIEGIARDITEHHLANQKLNFMSEHDTLTGILNRFSFYKYMKNLLQTNSNKDLNFYILYLDLDYFKEVNDTMGHDTGDLLLQNVVKRIQKIIRKDDVFARIGGDEFVVTLMDVNKNDVEIVAKKIVDVVKKKFHIYKYRINVSTSIGISSYPQDGKDLVELLKNADSAMYYTKEHGKSNFTYFSDI